RGCCRSAVERDVEPPAEAGRRGAQGRVHECKVKNAADRLEVIDIDSAAVQRGELAIDPRIAISRLDPTRYGEGDPRGNIGPGEGAARIENQRAAGVGRIGGGQGE